MRPIRFKCHPGIGNAVTGVALVASDDFSARYDLNRLTGYFSRPAHQLYGQSYVGRILVLRTAKGGVASAWMLREMAQRRIAPLGYVFNSVNPILAQGAAFADAPMVDRFDDGDVTTLIETGDLINVDPVRGVVTILEPVMDRASGISS
jgi:predicted aconitase with swiveling domain